MPYTFFYYIFSFLRNWNELGARSYGSINDFSFTLDKHSHCLPILSHNLISATLLGVLYSECWRNSRKLNSSVQTFDKSPYNPTHFFFPLFLHCLLFQIVYYKINYKDFFTVLCPWLTPVWTQLHDLVIHSFQPDTCVWFLNAFLATRHVSARSMHIHRSLTHVWSCNVYALLETHVSDLVMYS